MARKIDQFREGSLGLKLLPKPRYFHIGFGGLRCFTGLGSTVGATNVGYRCVSTTQQCECKVITSPTAAAGLESDILSTKLRTIIIRQQCTKT